MISLHLSALPASSDFLLEQIPSQDNPLPVPSKYCPCPLYSPKNKGPLSPHQPSARCPASCLTASPELYVLGRNSFPKNYSFFPFLFPKERGQTKKRKKKKKRDVYSWREDDHFSAFAEMKMWSVYYWAEKATSLLGESRSLLWNSH